MDVSVGTGMVALAISATVVAIVSRVIPQRPYSPESSNGKNGQDPVFVGRKEFDRHCQDSAQTFREIQSKLDQNFRELHYKLDQGFNQLQGRMEDHEKRLGVIEARHKDYTGDDLQGGQSSESHSRNSGPERRFGKKGDLGLRRRSSDAEEPDLEIRNAPEESGIGGDGKTDIGF